MAKPIKTHYEPRKKDAIGVTLEEALAVGMKFFNGQVCTRDPSHGTIRYTNNGGCMMCTRIRADVNRKKNGRSKDRNIVAGALKGNPTNYTHRVFVLGDPSSVGECLDKKWKFNV